MKFLFFLNQITMERPQRWGWFHLLWIGIAIAVVIFLVKKKTVKPNLVFGIYGFGAFLLEVTKQLMWSVEQVGGSYVWDYPWYIGPFQFCSIPMYVCILLCFIRKESIRNALLSFLAFFSILSMLSVMILPDTCFTSDVVVNIHTMYLHAGGLAVALYVLLTRQIDFIWKNWAKGAIVYLICVAMALALDIAVYQSGVLGDEVFNMFYISPYFESTLPVFCDLWHLLPYPVFLLLYLTAFAIGSIAVLLAGSGISKGLSFLKRRSERRARG